MKMIMKPDPLSVTFSRWDTNYHFSVNSDWQRSYKRLFVTLYDRDHSFSCSYNFSLGTIRLDI